MFARKPRPILLHLVSLCFLAAVGAAPCRAQNNPVADTKAVVIAGKARFTVLTPQMIRMEWAADGQFEDRASMVFLNRRLPVPRFSTRNESEWLVLETEHLRLRYRKDGGKFDASNLIISFQLGGQKVEWNPGAEDKGNLRGTTRTLDGVRGATELEPGLLSRDGWVLVDDTARPVFDSSDWPWVVPRSAAERQDWYFLGYGRNYRQALADFTRVAGKIPLPPRFAFGVWWSRYWAYSDQEFKELVTDFQNHNIPLDVLVIDMDWHPTFGVKWWENKLDQAGHRLGWTGYSWSKLYFPDPPGFLAWADKQGLKTPLNLHPASGVQPHEDAYPEMARAMGMDPASKRYVPFDIASKKFAENYFKFLHHPLEAQGVDFWWLDWQQQHTTSLPGVNPTWWLNYVHFTDMERRGKRPILFHRWGGLGNHRYQIGFSGDTICVWESLAFQPHFTATASNVLYGYWSHDIGGHMIANLGRRPEVGKPFSPEYAELYMRWIQYGVFSPILRTHTTKDPYAERRIWAYPLKYYRPMRDAFLLRYALIPYVYSAARAAYDTGVSLVRPMYYHYPENYEAYDFKDQYMFGEDLLVAPVTAPVEGQGETVKRALWLPPGQWFEWFTGAWLSGPAVVHRPFALEEIPVYVRAGAVIPMQPEMPHTGAKPVDPLILTIVPRVAGEARVYEDEGNSPGYQRGEHTWTTIRSAPLAAGQWKIEVLPVEGKYPDMLTERGYEIRLLGTLPPKVVRARGRELSFVREEGAPGWRYDGEKATTVITLAKSKVAQKIEITVDTQVISAEQAAWLDGLPARLTRLRRALDALNTTWPQGWSPDSLLEAVQTGNRISLRPETALVELEKLHRALPALREEIRKLDVDAAARERALAFLDNM